MHEKCTTPSGRISPGRPAKVETLDASYADHEKVPADAVLNLQYLDVLSYFHVSFDDDGQNKVEHLAFRV